MPPPSNPSSNFIKRWKVAHYLQVEQLEERPGAENAVPSFLWAYQAACTILNQRYTSSVTMPRLEKTLSRLQALSPQYMPFVKREAWANLPGHRVKTILNAALHEAQFVYLFFSRQYSNLEPLRRLPLLDWPCITQNPFLNLTISSQITGHWPKGQVSWLGFLGSPGQSQQNNKAFSLAPSFSGMSAQLYPLRHSLAKVKTLSLRFALGELLRQEQQILRKAFQHVSKLPESFPPPTVDLFRVYLHQQPNPRKASSFAASIDEALLKSTQYGRKMKVLSRFVNSTRSLAVLLRADLDAKRLYLKSLVSVKDRGSAGETYAPAEKIQSRVVAWDRFTRREVNALFEKVKISKKKWLHELEEHLYSSDSEDTEGSVPERREQNLNRPMGFFEDEFLEDSEDKMEEQGGAAGAEVKPAWWSHLQSLLSSESTPEHKNFRVLVKQTLKNMLLCSMKNQFIQLDRFGDHFRLCNRSIKRVAAQLGLRSIREQEEKHLRSVQKQLDLLFRRSAPMFGALGAGAPQLKANFELLLNFKKRFIVKVLLWFFLVRGVYSGETQETTKSLSAELVLTAALCAFDSAVLKVMRDECQSLLDEPLYAKVGEWAEKIQASQAVLERKMHAWRVPLPSSPDSEDLLWKQIHVCPWQQEQGELDTLFPPALDLQSWRTVDRSTGRVVGAVRHWKKSTNIRQKLCRARWEKSQLSTSTSALARRLLEEVTTILRGMSVHSHPRVFAKRWVQTELLFASLAYLETLIAS